MSLRVAVLVSGEGSNLQALLDVAVSAADFEVVCVASSRSDARALERARVAGVEAAVFARRDFDSREERDAQLASWLDSRAVELVVLAGFMELLSREFVGRFRGRIVNVHPSLLPSFPGVGAVEQAIAYGVRVMGVTVHFVDEGVDSGPIILQESFDAVPYARDIRAVERTVHEVEHRLLPRAVRLIAAGAVSIDGADSRRVLIEERGDGGD